METQNHTSCKHNYTLLFFLHLRGTNHIAGSRLSIGKAGGYSKEQDKKKIAVLNKLSSAFYSLATCALVLEILVFCNVNFQRI